MSTETPIPARQGDSTREALIRAAIDAFGRNGFNGASTRAIAEAAGANQALIGYHFGGKAGLYLAVFEHIATIMQQRISPALTAIEAQLELEEPANARSETAQQYLASLQRVVDALLAILTSDESAPWASLILREQQSPSEGFDVLYTRCMSRVLGVIARLIGRIRRTEAASEETRLTALTIVGQALMFRAARAAVMRQMDWRAIGRAEVNLIQETLHRNIAAIVSQENFR